MRAIGNRRDVARISKVAVSRPTSGDPGPVLTRGLDAAAKAVNELIDRDATIAVRIDSGVDLGPRHRLNLIPGSNVTIAAADDAHDGEVDITISSSGGGSFVLDWGTVP